MPRASSRAAAASASRVSCRSCPAITRALRMLCDAAWSASATPSPVAPSPVVQAQGAAASASGTPTMGRPARSPAATIAAVVAVSPQGTARAATRSPRSRSTAAPGPPATLSTARTRSVSPPTAACWLASTAAAWRPMTPSWHACPAGPERSAATPTRTWSGPAAGCTSAVSTAGSSSTPATRARAVNVQSPAAPRVASPANQGLPGTRLIVTRRVPAAHPQVAVTSRASTPSTGTGRSLSSVRSTPTITRLAPTTPGVTAMGTRLRPFDAESSGVPAGRASSWEG